MERTNLKTTRVKLDPDKAQKHHNGLFIIKLDGKERTINNVEFEFDNNDKEWFERLWGTRGIIEVDKRPVTEGSDFVWVDHKLLSLKSLLEAYQKDQKFFKSRENSIIITNLEDCIVREKSKTDHSIFE